MLKVGNRDIAKIYAGAIPAKKAYVGSELVWPSRPDYLCFQNIGSANSTITLKPTGSPPDIGLLMSRNGDSWSALAKGGSFTLAPGAKMYIQASQNNSAIATSETDYLSFSASTGALKVSGDITYVLSPNGNVTSIGDYGLSNLFRANTALVDASALVVPVTETGNRSFFSTFRECSNLRTAPRLEPMACSDVRGLARMFQNCTSLTSAPDISLTRKQGGVSPDNYCLYMFYGCSSLATTPRFSSTITGVQQIFYGMFRNCTSLTSAHITDTISSLYKFRECFMDCSALREIEVDFTSWNAQNYTFYNWVFNVPEGGTFIKPAKLPTQFGDSAIPYGWTVVDKT